MCNPYGGAVFGAIVGGLISATLGSGAPSYTPSPHLVQVESPDDFEEKILRADRPALVEFYSRSCPPCKRMEPIMHSLADRFAGRLVAAKVNAPALSEVAKRYRVRAVPTIILFKDGKDVVRKEGYQSEDKLIALIGAHAPEAREPEAEQSTPE
jgi:thioredoxin 1